MRRVKIPLGLRPLSPAERRRVTRDNDRALFPSVLVRRYEMTVRAFEEMARQAGTPPETPDVRGGR
jgi:hypothetical protein